LKISCVDSYNPQLLGLFVPPKPHSWLFVYGVKLEHRGQFLYLFVLLFQCDLPHRQVDINDIECFYKEHNFIGWTETSTKEGLMVNDSMK
jgi:hypothetical protein